MTLKKGTIFIPVFLVLITVIQAGALDRTEHFKLWHQFEDEGKFEEAISVFLKVLEEHPDEAWCYLPASIAITCQTWLSKPAR